MANRIHCKNCKKHNTSFENKFCSIKCADLYDGLCPICTSIKYKTITEKEVDISDSSCKNSVYKIEIEMKNLKINEILKVITNNSEAKKDIIKWIRQSGHELLNTPINGIFKIKKVIRYE